MRYEDIQINRAYYIVTEPRYDQPDQPRAYWTYVHRKWDSIELIQCGVGGHEHFYTADQVIKPANRSDPPYIYFDEYPCKRIKSYRYSDLENGANQFRRSE